MKPWVKVLLIAGLAVGIMIWLVAIGVTLKLIPLPGDPS
jgi:hypothetical protein